MPHCAPLLYPTRGNAFSIGNEKMGTLDKRPDSRCSRRTCLSAAVSSYLGPRMRVPNPFASKTPKSKSLILLLRGGAEPARQPASPHYEVRRHFPSTRHIETYQLALSRTEREPFATILLPNSVARPGKGQDRKGCSRQISQTIQYLPGRDRTRSDASNRIMIPLL